MKPISRFSLYAAVIAALSFSATGFAAPLPPQKGSSTKKGADVQKGQPAQDGTIQNKSQGQPGDSDAADDGQATGVGQHAQPNPGNPYDPKRPVPEGSWFKKVHHDFGTHYEQRKMLLEGSYEFQNSTGKDQSIKDIQTSCKCQGIRLFVNGKEAVLARNVERKLEKPIPVPKGAKGVIKLRFDVSGGEGQRTGDIRVTTTDKKMETAILTCAALIKPAYVVDPKVIDLGRMSPVEKKDWSAVVRCMVRKKWEVKSVDPVKPQGLVVKSMEKKADEDGSYYLIKGTYGPDLQEGAYGGTLLFHTDAKDAPFTIQVLADVKARVMIDTTFFSFKSFPRNEPQTHTVSVWPVDPQRDTLEIDRVELVNPAPNFPRDHVECVIEKPGKDKKIVTINVAGFEKQVPGDKLWRLHFRTKPGIKGRVLRFKAKIHFKDKGTPPKLVRVNGFPRG